MGKNGIETFNEGLDDDIGISMLSSWNETSKILIVKDTVIVKDTFIKDAIMGVLQQYVS